MTVEDQALPPGSVPQFPTTRYQGSKRKLVAGILDQLGNLEFDTVLDAFGGTGSVAYAFKAAGKAVTYNDLLAFNHQIGLALIENDSIRLSEQQIERIAASETNGTGGDFIRRTFSGIYFTDEENAWLDAAVANVATLEGAEPFPAGTFARAEARGSGGRERSSLPDGCARYARAIAWFAIFQAAMAKRPYNLFHRANLYMRTAQVRRSFGNKATWDRSFADHFRAAADEANRAVIDSGGRCRAIRRDVLDVEPGFDLVYIDTPYINDSGVGVDYRGFYHFLEGLVRYDEWPTLIDQGSKHRRLLPQPDPWSNPTTCREMFGRLFERFRDSHLVVSYRSDGIPTIEELSRLLRNVKRRVRVIEGERYQYVLSTRRKTREALLIGSDA